MKIIAAVPIALFAYLAFWPVPIEPVAWDAPDAPALDGAYAGNDRLAAIDRIAVGIGVGPEDVAVGPAGRIYAGYEDGRIVRFAPDGGDPLLFADTGGRPLGLEVAPDGSLEQDAIGVLDLTAVGSQL